MKDNPKIGRYRSAAHLSLLLAFACFASTAAAFDPLNGDYSRADPLDIRIASYNHNRNFIEDSSRDATFARILGVIDPDIVCFQEFTSAVSANDLAARMEAILPAGAPWNVHLGQLDGVRTAIASRFPILMTDVDTVPASSTRGVNLALVDLPDADYDGDLYILGVHLKCCGSSGSSEDEKRQDSVDAIANWLADARGLARPSGDQITLADDTPMIVLGDFNLVGGPQPEDTLLTGDIQDELTYGPDAAGDWDESTLVDLAPTDPFTGDTFTWQGNGKFPPSNLDRIIYTDHVAMEVNSFVLNTDTMTSSALNALGLQAGDTLPQNSSDHLPIVLDLQLGGTPCTSNPDCDDGLFCNGAETCVGDTCQGGSDSCPGQPCDEDVDQCVVAAGGNPWINEFHYDNTGSDVGEFVEIAGPAGLDLTDWQVVGYNGSTQQSYRTLNLGGTIPDQQGCTGTIAFDFVPMENGSPDGLALIDPQGAVIEFLSYEGSFTAANGPAAGMSSNDIGVSEPNDTPVGHSLQRAGTGAAADNFTWQSAGPETRGTINTGQTFSGCTESVPATSVWALLIMVMLLLASGVLMIGRTSRIECMKNA